MATTTETTHANVPAGQGATSAKTFELIPPEQRKLDLRETDGRAEVTFTLQNRKFHPARARLEIEPAGATQREWLTVAGARNRDFRSREAQDFRVLIAIPPDTPANTFEFTAIGINEANPEEDFTDRERSVITIDWEPVPVVKRVRKWKLPLMILMPLLVLGSGGILFYVQHKPQPLDVLEQANRYAHAGDWANYWECWTEHGQHKLLYYIADTIRRDIADPTGDKHGDRGPDTERWKRQLSVWLPSFGLTLKDVQEAKWESSDPGERAQPLSRTIERHGSSAKTFFVAAAAWREPDRHDVPDETERNERILQTRRELMFWPLGREDFKESMADQMVLYSAVPYDKIAVSNDQPEQPTYAEADVLLVSFRNVNGVWVLDDFWKKANAP